MKKRKKNMKKKHLLTKHTPYLSNMKSRFIYNRVSCKVHTMVNLDPTQKETKNIINTIQNQRHLNLSALTILISMKLKEFSKCPSFSW